MERVSGAGEDMTAIETQMNIYQNLIYFYSEIVSI
jgi:hypothetical protein